VQRDVRRHRTRSGCEVQRQHRDSSGSRQCCRTPEPGVNDAARAYRASPNPDTALGPSLGDIHLSYHRWKVRIAIPTRDVASTLIVLLVLTTPSPGRAQTCPAGTRTVTVTNDCGATLWIGAVGNRPNTKAGAPTCASGTECDVNQYCDSAITHQCTFIPVGATLVPSTRACSANADCAATEFCSTATGTCASVPPDGNGWELPAGGGQAICVPTPWAGRFWARTGCRFSGTTCGSPGVDCCDTGSCLGDDNKTFSLYCRLSAVPPATLVELNFLTYPTEDTYDVSMVDGFNVAVEIAPASGTFDSTLPPGTFYAPWCGRPGCAENCASVTPCSWKIDAASCPFLMQAVVPQHCSRDPDCPTATSKCNPAGICTCVTSADCASGQVCGTSALNGGSRTCGPYVGCLSAAKACAADPTLGAPLDCSVNDDLFGCTGATYGASCYTSGASSACCGCPTWSPAGTCAGTNARWSTLAESTPFPPSTAGFAKTFHDVCPNAYSYQYDDKVSTFSCRGTGAASQPDYAITFCPGSVAPPPIDPCASSPAGSIAAAACACDHSVPASCNDTIPGAVRFRLSRACTRIDDASRAQRRMRKLLTRGVQSLAGARRAARRLARRDKTPCGADLVASIGDALQRTKQARRTQ
jgi:Thaumatin family